jgi:multidrug efflux pump subunit AcrB
LKRRLENFTGASVKVEAQESGPPSGHAVSYEVVGQDYAVLGMYADSLLQILERYAEFKLIDTDFEPAKPELQVLVNRDKAAYYGVSVQEVAGTIRNAIHGATIGEFRLGEDEYDIVVRYQDRFRNSVDRLSGLQVVDRNGARIPVDELASIQSASSVGTIQRRNLRRAVSVWADFKDDIQNKNEIKEEIEAQIAKLNLPAGYRVQEGEGEAMRNEATEYLGQAFLVAIFLIVLVLIAQFNSIVQPAIIIASVFLSLGGVFWGYFLSGDDFVIIMSGIGCIALAGVAVNNCIVLVDYTNLLIKWGVPWHEAVIEAGKTRLRPVLLTAITTVLGLMPMAFGVSLDLHPGSFGIQLASESSAFWKAFARAMIYGLSFATAMTLVVVPVMLSLSFRIWPPKAEKQAQ